MYIYIIIVFPHHLAFCTVYTDFIINITLSVVLSCWSLGLGHCMSGNISYGPETGLPGRGDITLT